MTDSPASTLAPASLLLQPHSYDPSHFDAETRRLLRATIDHFEARGKQQLTEDFHGQVYYSDFLDFVAREGVFAKLMTPARDGGGDPDKRWDTSRIAAMSEVLGFYGIDYWYPWQVTALGLGPVWQSDNAVARARAAEVLQAGGIAAFGLSERDHGADIYSSDMVLTPDGAGGYRATGGKYYIGNGQAAGFVSVFGRIEGVEGFEQYVFFAADSRHENYHVVKNIVPSQMYVSEFRLQDYPVSDADILHTGAEAFSAALNTVNVGKFNLCFGGLGAATHAFYETITHAHNRVLYGAPVTTFPHVRRQFVDAYARLLAMRLFADRAVDYFRCANPDDRRYLLYNPVTKMKVTTEAETVCGLLGDIASAKGFEKDTFLPIATQGIHGLPKLEGTVAINLALILKFMPAYLRSPVSLDPIPTRLDAADDEFLFRQGPARGLSKVRFHDWREAYEPFSSLPNVAVFTEQASALDALLDAAPVDGGDLDLQLAVGELFTLVVYGQLMLEQAQITGLDHEVVDQIFAVLIRDFSAGATELYGKSGSNEAQQAWALAALRRPITDPEAFERVWQQVQELSGAYEMNP
jgi:acyl-CoA dehydrogenase